MTKKTDPGCLHRRRFLQRGLLGAAAAGVAAQAAIAAPDQSLKASKKTAGYIDRDHPATQMCMKCGYYIDPLDCVVVEGPVSPWGWCNYYED
jgi:hypothetical protein